MPTAADRALMEDGHPAGEKGKRPPHDAIDLPCAASRSVHVFVVRLADRMLWVDVHAEKMEEI